MVTCSPRSCEPGFPDRRRAQTAPETRRVRSSPVFGNPPDQANLRGGRRRGGTGAVRWRRRPVRGRVAGPPAVRLAGSWVLHRPAHDGGRGDVAALSRPTAELPPRSRRLRPSRPRPVHPAGSASAARWSTTPPNLARITALVVVARRFVLQGLHHLWPPLESLLRPARAGHQPRRAGQRVLEPSRRGGAPTTTATPTRCWPLQVEGSKTWQIDGLGPVTMDPRRRGLPPCSTGHAVAAPRSDTASTSLSACWPRPTSVAVQRVVAGAVRRPRSAPAARLRPSGPRPTTCPTRWRRRCAGPPVTT